MIMPDIDFQKIELNLIPKKGEQPVVFYASQYETARPFIAVLKWGDSEFAPGVDCYAEIDIRKNDDNLVVITDDVAIDNNEVSVILPVQALTCIGKNLGQVKIYAADDQLIAALNFILEVQADPLAGGVTSETAIDNLTQQIEDITQEVIGEDYYNKTETDALLADKADKSELPDMTDYYTKTQTDNLLNDKADRTDLATLASKAELTQAISDEDTAVKNWAYTQFATPGYVASNYYNKLQVDALIDNIFPTFTASGAVASFITALTKPFVSVTAEAGATTITRCGVNLFDDTCLGYYTDEITLPAGTYYFKGFISTTGTDQQNTRFYWLDDTNTWQIITASGSYDNGAITWTGSAFGWESGTFYATVTLTKPETFRMSCSNTTANTRRVGIFLTNVDTFTPYNGQTVPVADATTLTTLSGINNVFADSGDVTVQYKYMSM